MLTIQFDNFTKDELNSDIYGFEIFLPNEFKIIFYRDLGITEEIRSDEAFNRRLKDMKLSFAIYSDSNGNIDFIGIDSYSMSSSLSSKDIWFLNIMINYLKDGSFIEFKTKMTITIDPYIWRLLFSEGKIYKQKQTIQWKDF